MIIQGLLSMSVITTFAYEPAAHAFAGFCGTESKNANVGAGSRSLYTTCDNQKFKLRRA